MPLMRGQVKADQRLFTLRAARGSSRPKRANQSVLDLLKAALHGPGLGWRHLAGDRHISPLKHRPPAALPAATYMSNVCPASPERRSDVKHPISEA